MLDRHAPLITRPIIVRSNTPWHTTELLHAKRKLRQAERKWRLTKLQVHRDIYTCQHESYKQEIQWVKAKLYAKKIEEYARNSKALFKVMDFLMKRNNAPKLQCPVSGIAQITDVFLKHFTRRKLFDIRSQLASRRVLTVNTDYVQCEVSCSVCFLALPHMVLSH